MSDRRLTMPAATVRRRAARGLAAAALAAGAAAAPARADEAVFQWASPTNGDWGTAANWNPMSVPNASDAAAVINVSGGSGYAVALDGDYTVDTLTLGSADATINHTAGTLTFNTATLSAGTYNLSGGTLAGGTLNLAGGTFNVTSGNQVSTLSGVTFTGGDVNVGESLSLNVQNGLNGSGGSLNLAIAATLGLTGPDQTLDNVSVNATGEYATLNLGDNTSAAATMFTLGPHASLTGPFTVSDNNSFGNTLVNQGTINAIPGVVPLTVQNAAFANTGLAEATNGSTLTLNAASWNNSTGRIEAAAGSTVNVGGSTTTAMFGTVIADPATDAAAAGTVNLTGTLDNTSASLNVNASTGSYRLAGGTITGGTINQSGGATLSVAPGLNGNVSSLVGVTVTGGDLNVLESGSLNVSNGLTVASGNLNLAIASTLILSGTNPTLDNLTVQVTGEYAYLSLNADAPAGGGPATVTLGPGASLIGPLTVSDAPGRATTLVNRGTINGTTSIVPLTIQNAAFVNTGLVEATNGGTLTLNAASWNNSTGRIEAAAGSIVNLGGSTTTAMFGAVIADPATDALAAGTVNLTGVLDNTSASLNLNASTGRLSLAGGTITGGTISQTGGATLNVSSGTLAGVTVTGADLTVAASGTLHVQGGITVATANLNLSGGATLFLDGPSQTVDNLTINATGVYANLVLNGNDALTNGQGQTYTIGTHAAIIGPVEVTDGNGQNTLANQGTINANGGGYGATFITTSYFSNQGLAEATNGGQLTIQPSQQAWNNSGGTVLATGSGSSAYLLYTITNTGTVSAANGGLVNLEGTLIGGTANVSGGTFVESGTAALAGSLVFQASGTGGLAEMSNANTYTGGTTIAGGATVQANSPAGSLGSGRTAVNPGGILVGTGATGGPVTVAGGTVSPGSGATANDAIGTLTTGAQNWSSGTFVDKVSSTASAAGVGHDLLILNGLTVPNPSGFTVSLVATAGSTPAFTGSNAALTATTGHPAAGSYIVLAQDAEGSGSPFNNPAVVSALNLTVTGVATAGSGQAIRLDGYFDGTNYDLIAEDVAAPEPSSLLLGGLAAAPLALGRRRRRGR